MICENIKCNKEHDGSYGSGRFCGSSCAHSFATIEKREEINKKVSEKLTVTGKYKRHYEVTECLNCNTHITNRGKFCSLPCSKEFEYKEYIKKWKKGIVDGTKAGGVAVSNHVRRYLFDKFDNKCSKCGWNEKNTVSGKIPLHVDHIDGNSNNNSEENLDVLCPNCHSLTPTYGSLNNGNGNRKRLMYYRYKPPLSN